MIATLLALCAFDAGATQPYPIVPLLTELDVIPGVGGVSSVRSIQVTNDGDWIVEAFLSAPSDSNNLLIRNGVVLLREGDPVPEPPGMTIESRMFAFEDNGGDIAWFSVLGGAPSLYANDGLFYNDVLVLQEGDLSIAHQLAPGTIYTGGFFGHPGEIFYFQDVKINGLDQIALRATFEETDPAWNLFEALVRIQVNENGVRQSESVVVRVDEILDGQTDPVRHIGQFDINDRGRVLHRVDMDLDLFFTDSAIYLDDQLIAEEGGFSPVFPRLFEEVGPGLALNNHGDHAFGAVLDGDDASDQVIVKNGLKVVQEGDTLPAIAPFVLASNTALGPHRPVAMDDNRNVLWHGTWNSGVNDRGLFLNKQLIVQRGLTAIDGLPVSWFEDSGGYVHFSMSDNGRFIGFLATLEGGARGAFMLEVVAPSPVPDGRMVAGTQAMAAKAANGTGVEITWDATSCPAADYNLVYGSLASVSSLAYAGAECGLGTSGSTVFTPPPGDVFWILVGVDGEGRESSHGFESSGAPRDVSSAGMCGVEIQVNASSCPAD